MNFISATSSRSSKLKNSSRYLIKWDGTCRSKFQKKIKTMLEPYWFADIVFEELPVMGTRLTIDFFNSNKRIALEVDGRQHYAYNKFFHGKNRQNFLDQISRDEIKESFCEKNNITLIRITEDDKLSIALLKELELI